MIDGTIASSPSERIPSQTCQQIVVFRWKLPAGLQGGLLAAMLDATLGPALLAKLGPGQFAPTTDLHVQFLRPARPGRITGRGRVVRRGKDVAFTAGELLDDSGQIMVVATATAQIRAQRP
jgi:uncharacterized protein (TIGR00369 family)